MRRIELNGVRKAYRTFRSPFAKLKEIALGRQRHQEKTVLDTLSLAIDTGEVVGIVGVNGAGKSTLLKLIAKTLQPTQGTIRIQGRVCALLELGAGFHPEMTGRENVYLVAAIQGRNQQETDQVYDAIVDFAGLSKVMDQPVKTYSSGMMIRLAFSIATSVDPDILILDEALSVGDGAFARRSFERIMQFRDAGKTILFCSHSMYQVEAICSRVLWIDQGQLVMDSSPSEVVVAYNAFLDELEANGESSRPLLQEPNHGIIGETVNPRVRFTGFDAGGAAQDKVLPLRHHQSDLEIRVAFRSDPEVGNPTIAMSIVGSGGRPIASASTLIDGFMVSCDTAGNGEVKLQIPKISLLKGRYWVNFYLLCNRGLHIHDRAEYVFELDIRQDTSEIGVVSLPHHWINLPSVGEKAREA